MFSLTKLTSDIRSKYYDIHGCEWTYKAEDPINVPSFLVAYYVYPRQVVANIYEVTYRHIDSVLTPDSFTKYINESKVENITSSNNHNIKAMHIMTITTSLWNTMLLELKTPLLFHDMFNEEWLYFLIGNVKAESLKIIHENEKATSQ